jgi:ABC-type maltose transport system permease subunit
MPSGAIFALPVVGFFMIVQRQMAGALAARSVKG